VPYSMKIDQPNLGDEGELMIHGLGTFKNGQTYDITDEQAQVFREATARDSGEVISDPEHELHGVQQLARELGPSLLDAQIYGVTVTEVGSSKDDDPPATLTPSSPVVSLSGGAPADNDDEGGAS
jgi:hypothetical protein